MKSEKKEFIVSDRTLQGFIYEPSESAKGILLIVHGMAEHIERYHDFASFISNANYIVVGYNQRGHGDQDIPSLGYIAEHNGFELFVDDLNRIVSHIKESYPNTPIFILGHSMGSFIVQRYLQREHPLLQGAILSGSNYRQGAIVNLGIFLASIQVGLFGPKYKSKLLDNLSFGAFNKSFKPNRTAFDWLTRDEKIVDLYIASPLDGQVFSASFFRDFLRSLKTIGKQYAAMPSDVPLFIFSGAKDPVGNFGKGVTKLYLELCEYVKDITMKLYPNARHEMLNEINKEEVFQDVLHFLEKHEA